MLLVYRSCWRKYELTYFRYWHPSIRFLFLFYFMISIAVGFTLRQPS